jgi:hypothetical protein
MDENSLVEDLRGDSMELVARLEVKLDQTLSMLASCMGKMALHDSKLANIETKLEELGERRRSGASQETSSSSSPVSVANANSSSASSEQERSNGALLQALSTAVERIPKCHVPAAILREQGATVGDLAAAHYSEGMSCGISKLILILYMIKHDDISPQKPLTHSLTHSLSQPFLVTNLLVVAVIP